MEKMKPDSPEKAALREMMGDYMRNNDVRIKNGANVKSIM